MPNKTRVAYVRLTVEDHAALRVRAAKVGVSLAEFLRRAGLSAPIRVVPDANRRAWTALARTAANLNQIAHHLNAVRLIGREPIINDDLLRRDLGRMERALGELRRLLIGEDGP